MPSFVEGGVMQAQLAHDAVDLSGFPHLTAKLVETKTACPECCWVVLLLMVRCW